MKYLAWLERAHGYLLERSSADAPLFPSALPYPEVIGLRGRANGVLDALQWGRVFVNTLMAWSNFVVLGCPDGEGSAFEPRVAHRSVEGIRPYADKLLGEVANFSSPEVLSGALSCEGKGKDLEDLVASGTGACYSGVVRVENQRLSTALPVVADRVAVLEEAGLVDPRQILEGHSPPLDKDIRGGEWVQDNPLYYSGLGGVGGGLIRSRKTPPPHHCRSVPWTMTCDRERERESLQSRRRDHGAGRAKGLRSSRERERERGYTIVLPIPTCAALPIPRHTTADPPQ